MEMETGAGSRGKGGEWIQLVGLGRKGKVSVVEKGGGEGRKGKRERERAAVKHKPAINNTILTPPSRKLGLVQGESTFVFDSFVSRN